VAGAIAARTVTYDLARVRGALTAPPRQIVEDKEGKKVTVQEDVQRLMPGATLVSCSGFGEEIVKHMRQARAKPTIAAVS
jgi:isocitrate dehydrogenase